MIATHTRAYRAIACLLSFSLTSLSLPYGAFKFTGGAQPSGPAKAEPARSRVLSAAEQRSRLGKLSVDPRFSGTTKYSVVHNGIDLLTGNFVTSATDMAFQGGYGIPVNVTRTYSANNGDEGPFGYGWILSVDLRSTAGGLVKSSGSPMLQVPVGFRERPPVVSGGGGNGGGNSPGANTPVEAVTAVDASGLEETIQRDVDGILTTPPWDRNVTRPEYEIKKVTSGGNTTVYYIMVRNTVTTPEGTVFKYEKQGEYDQGGGMVNLGSPTSDRVPSNVLKIASAMDRNGNTTYYEYDQNTTVGYQKVNGHTAEHPIKRIWMPDGEATVSNSPSTRYLQFAYNETHGGTVTPPSNRITSVTDGDRVVKYRYETDGTLATVESPGGKLTKYDYSEFDGDSNESPILVLSSIRDHRGLTTTIAYGGMPNPFGDYRPYACKVALPNGITTYAGCEGLEVPGSVEWPMDTELGASGWIGFQDRLGFAENNPGAPTLAFGRLVVSTNNTPPLITIEMDDNTVASPGQGVNYTGTLSWKKVYSAQTLDLLSEEHYTYRAKRSNYIADLSAERRLENTSWVWQGTKTETVYNFRGNPLHTTLKAATSTNGTSYTWSQLTEADTAYWGLDKYYQQKASRTKDKNGNWRYSLTDYFTSGDTSIGNRGQVKKVYDPKYGSYTFTGTTPSNTPSGYTWGYEIAPASGAVCAAEFEYDSQGRNIKVKKLRSVSGSTGTYVETTTSYESGTGHWGYPYEVVEDAGSGHIARTTVTDEYDHAGRATDVTQVVDGDDINDRHIHTVYLPDGEVDSVSLKIGSGGTPATMVVYDYEPAIDPDTASTPEARIKSGTLTSVTDGISGVVDTFTYVPSGGGIGQVSMMVESGPDIDGYSAAYTYNSFGDRETATFDTPNGLSQYKYEDYISLGSPDSSKRAFQTMNRMFPSGSSFVKDGEEFHYQYDSSGRLLEAAFAQYRQLDQNSNPIQYSSTYPALKRARQFTDYAPTGHILEQNTWDENWSSGAYSTQSLLAGVENEYEANTLLRSQTSYTAGGTSVHKFAYDEDNGMLTGASYNGGTTWDGWGYDAAGNRISESHGASSSTAFTYDNLNRMTQSANWTGTSFGTAFSYANDLLGNRYQRGSSTVQGSGYTLYGFDALNRMEKVVSANDGATFTYRADGQRVMKVKSSTLTWHVTGQDSGYYDENDFVNMPTTRYYHDGQMPVEEDYLSSVLNDVDLVITRYALGARGVDMIAVNDQVNDEEVSFPVYDGHGNVILTIRRDGSNYLSGNARLYDAWGKVLGTSNPTGGPKQRYCGNLGHQTDDESGLIYMRARYYEPWTGRFISEDPARDGWNWYVYCGNEPVNKVDITGKSWEDLYNICMGIGILTYAAGAALLLNPITPPDPKEIAALIQTSALLFGAAAQAFAMAFGFASGKLSLWVASISVANLFVNLASGLLASKGFTLVGKIAVAALGLEATIYLGLLMGMNAEFE